MKPVTLALNSNRDATNTLSGWRKLPFFQTFRDGAEENDNDTFSVKGVLAAFGLFLALLTFSVWEHHKSEEASELIVRTVHVQTQLAKLFSELQYAESDQRSYLITGAENYRASYQKANSTFKAALIELQNSVSDNPQQQKKLDKIRDLALELFEAMTRTMSLRKHQEFDLSLSKTAISNSAALRDQIREEIISMEQQEASYLEERNEKSSTIRSVLYLVESILFISFFVIATFVFWHIKRSLAAQRRAEAKLLNMNETLEHKIATRTAALERSNAELAQFAVIASHDLQEPLRMVGSYLEILSSRYKGKLDAEADEFIGFAVDGATRMKALINDLLSYSRVSNQATELTPTHLDEVLDRARNMLSISIDETGTTFTNDPLPEVLADEDQLTQLFQNLVSNAIKYRSDNAPRIHISAERDGQSWRFSVTDNGIGIDPEFKDKVFEIFKRLHGRDKYEGTGIGLALCKRIVDHHHGKIWVEPAPTGGSVFHFTLLAS